MKAKNWDTETADKCRLPELIHGRHRPGDDGQGSGAHHGAGNMVPFRYSDKEDVGE